MSSTEARVRAAPAVLPPSELRNFGLVVGGAFALLGAFFLWRGRGYFWLPIILAIPLVLLALAAPAWLAPVRAVWMWLGEKIGWVTTRVILVLLFFLLITPIGLLARVVGKRFLELRFDGRRSSYWIPRPTSGSDRSRYERQY